MNIIKKGFKREYIKPSIVMFAMSNEEYLLAASPNVRPRRRWYATRKCDC